MKIILMRHGLAATVEQADVSFDAERPLTDEGELHARSVAAFLKKNEMIPSRILCTPFVRSNRTAEIISSEIGSIPVQPSTAILPGAGVEDLLGAVSKNSLDENELTLVCAHEPDTGHFLARLLLEQDDFPLHFLPGDVYVLNVNFENRQARGEIVAFFSPLNSENTQ